MYARNVSAFLLHLVKDGKLQLNTDDEIIRETMLTRGAKWSMHACGSFFAPTFADAVKEWRSHEAGSAYQLYVFMLAAFIDLKSYGAFLRFSTHLDVVDKRAGCYRRSGSHPSCG